ncbi:MAG: hypothetical protein Q9218_002436 [Villophora microphyllina]
MTRSLLSLPCETLLAIANHLVSATDYIHFARTHRILTRLLADEHTAKEALKRVSGRSDELRRVLRGELSANDALKSIYDRNKAFAAAKPISSIILGQASSFLYQQGVCAYVRGTQIRILSVHHGLETEGVIDLPLVGPQLLESDCRHTEVELCNLQSGLLTIVFHGETVAAGWRSWLVVLDVENYDEDFERLILAVDLWTPDQLIVRNTEKHLCVLTPTGTSATGRHREWIVRIWDLEDSSPRPLLLQIPELAVGESGHDLVFEVFDGHLYAVSTQSPNDMDEPEWTSYYTCCRVPLENPHPLTLETVKIWRRHHNEGPINDLWTTLNLFQDESTGELTIIEARKEWTGGSSRQRRTWYKQALPAQFTVPEVTKGEKDADTDPTSPNDDGDQVFATSQIQDSLLSGTSNQDPPYLLVTPPKNNPQEVEYSGVPRTLDQQPAHPRLLCNTHREYPLDAPIPDVIDNSILAKSRYRAYNQGASAFLDLVVDDRTREYRGKWDQQLRLRIGARRDGSPVDQFGFLYRRLIDQSTGGHVEGSEFRYCDTGIHLWPPADAPLALQDLLNGGSDPRDKGDSRSSWRTLGDVTAVSDERSILYLIKKKGSFEDDWGRLVLVNFDKQIHFQHEMWSPSLMKLYGDKRSSRTISTDEQADQVAMKGMIEKVYEPPVAMDLDDDEESEHAMGYDDAKKPDMAEKYDHNDKAINDPDDDDVDCDITPTEEDDDLFFHNDDESVDLEWFMQQMALWTDIKQGYQFA